MKNVIFGLQREELFRAFDALRNLPEDVRNKYAYKEGQSNGYAGYFELGSEK